MKIKITLIILTILCSCSDASSNEKEILESEATTSINKAEFAEQTNNIELALFHYQKVIDSNDSRYVERSYAGKGFSLIRLGKIKKAYKTFTEGLSKKPESLHLKAGMSFLEYSYKGNFQKAMVLANEVLSKKPKYKRKKGIDFLDLKLTIAQCYYALARYHESLSMVKEINPEFDINLNETNFKLLLLSELRRLAIKLR